MSGRTKVIIAGGGFGGLRAAQALKSAPVDVTLIDRNNYHLFQPLLNQVATGSLSPVEIAAPDCQPPKHHVDRSATVQNARLFHPTSSPVHSIA